jgi:thioredoxin reductase (NADPH)
VFVTGSNGTQKVLAADRLLPLFGMVNDLGPIAEWGLEVADGGILVAPATCEASIPGIYAIGDIANYPGKLKLILSGFAEAAAAMHAAHPRIFPDTPLHFEHSTTKGVPAQPLH